MLLVFMVLATEQHATVMQWCRNTDHYSDSLSASRCLILMCWTLSKAAGPQILTNFVWRAGDRTINLPHARRTFNQDTTRGQGPRPANVVVERWPGKREIGGWIPGHVKTKDININIWLNSALWDTTFRNGSDFDFDLSASLKVNLMVQLDSPIYFLFMFSSNIIVA